MDDEHDSIQLNHALDGVGIHSAEGNQTEPGEMMLVTPTYFLKA
jgi:hypothetical protein